MSKASSTVLEQLFIEHAQGLVNFLKRKLASAEDAEDIAQNAFIRIQRLAEKQQLDNPKAYLYQTAANLTIDLKRRESLYNNYIAQTPEDVDIDGHSPERLLSARDELECVESAIKALPHNCKQAFLLHRVRGMSYNEIAMQLNVSVSCVEKYILQALKQSRKALERSSRTYSSQKK